MFILNLFLLLLNSFLLSGIFGTDLWIEFFVFSIIFFYSQILGISIVLGLFHLLYQKYFFLSLLIIFLLLILRIKKIKTPKLQIIPPLNSLFLSIVFAIHITYTFITLNLPPLTTDGLLYHLPFAVHYFKTHSVSLPNLYFTDIALTYYPIGGEVFYFFSLFSFREFLFKYIQYPFLLLGCFSVFLILKSFDFSNFLCLTGALIFSLIKPVFMESRMEFVDLMVAATFISTIYFFQKDEKKYIVPGILSLSLCLSIKTLSVIFAILTLPFLFFKKKGKLTKSFYFSLGFLIFFGLFAYIRNFILTGNPLYPAEISIGNFILFKGPYIITKMPLLERFKNLFYIIAFSSMHIDPPFHLKIILILFFGLSLILSFKNKKLLIFHLIFPISVLLYGVLIPPFYYQIRHFLPIYGILTVCMINPFKKFQYLCIPVFLYFCISALRLPFFIYFLLCLLLLLISLFLVSHLFKKPILYVLYFFIFIFVLIFQIEKTNFIYGDIKFSGWNRFYKKESSLWEFIQKNSNSGKNIVYIGDFLIYPFYGNKFQNNVFYQSVNSIDTLPIYKYSFESDSEEIFYRKKPSFQLWFEGLKNKKVDYLIVKKDGEYIEKNWIEEHKEFFKEVFSSDFAIVYEFWYNIKK
ncbi:MAG: hypothetical protein NC915_05700 [Candidatus Omnitrophica bacterium]|nr:hypothetical protein [Candidatus Omnitrophota bacterium]